MRNKAIWDQQSVITFCDICIVEIEAGRRPGTHFTKLGWENVMTNFNKATGRIYDKVQLKNKWDGLKNDWRLWKQLIGKETGLEWNPIRKTIDASEEWWNNKLQVLPSAAKFRRDGIDPEIEEKLDKMFVNTTATPLSCIHPSGSGDTFRDNAVRVESSDNSDDSIPTDTTEGSNARLSGTQSRKRKRGKWMAAGEEKVGGVAKLSQQIERLVEAVEKISSKMDKHFQGASIPEVMRELNSLPGVEPGSNLWMHATKLLKSEDNRQIFSAIEDPEIKLKWLKFELLMD